MKILFVVKTYHDGDEYIINNKNLLHGKNYHDEKTLFEVRNIPRVSTINLASLAISL